MCADLGVPHYVLNYREAFKASVIEPFISAWKHGVTPNPCVVLKTKRMTSGHKVFLNIASHADIPKQPSLLENPFVLVSHRSEATSDGTVTFDVCVNTSVWDSARGDAVGSAMGQVSYLIIRMCIL